jgi:molybdopterin converting factor small subunit
MAVVYIPSLLRSLTGGEEKVRASGVTLGAVLEDVLRQHPQLAGRVLEAGALRPEIMIAVGGDEASDLGTVVGEEAEVRILPAIAGGT